MSSDLLLYRYNFTWLKLHTLCNSVMISLPFCWSWRAKRVVALILAQPGCTWTTFFLVGCTIQNMIPVSVWAQSCWFLLLSHCYLMFLEIAPSCNLEFQVLLLALVHMCLIIWTTYVICNFWLIFFIILLFQELSTALTWKDRWGSSIWSYFSFISCLSIRASVLKGVHAWHHYTKLNH